MDKYDPSSSDVLRGIGGLNVAPTSVAYDPVMSKALRLAENQYLRNTKIILPSVGVDSAALLKRTPARVGMMPQVSEWAQGLCSAAEQVGSIFSKVDQFVDNIADYAASIATWAGPGFDAIRALETVSGLDTVIGALPKVQDLNRFWDVFAPALEEFSELMEDTRDGGVVLEEAEFGFADHLWDIFYLRGFANIPQVVRSAVATNKLTAHTRSDEFVEQLRAEVSSSRLMSRRWRVIEPAIEAHAGRKYELSVPVFLSQIEGAVGDVMLLKDLVLKEGNKYYLADEFGNFKVNKKGKRLAPVTLSPGLKNARLDEQVELAAASQFMADVMVQRRNDVMHGRDIDYGRAKFSVQALLILRVLVQGVVELEGNGH